LDASRSDPECPRQGRWHDSHLVPRLACEIGYGERLCRGLHDHSTRQLPRQVLAESLRRVPLLLEDLLRRVPNADLGFLPAQIDRNMLHGWPPVAPSARTSFLVAGRFSPPRARGGQPLHSRGHCSPWRATPPTTPAGTPTTCSCSRPCPR